MRTQEGLQRSSLTKNSHSFIKESSHYIVGAGTNVGYSTLQAHPHLRGHLFILNFYGMKKLVMTFLLGALVSGFVMAQDQKDQKTDHKEWDKKVKTELKLTGDQLTKYDAISTEYEGKMETLKKDASLSPDAQKQKKMELKSEKQAKLFEFFTPEQQTKYKELVEQKKAAKSPGS